MHKKGTLFEGSVLGIFVTRGGTRAKGGLLSLKNPRDRVSRGDDLDAREVSDNFSGGRPKSNRWRRLTVLVLVVCAVVAALVAVDYLKHYGTIYPGVEIGNVALGGKTPEEARAALEERTAALKEVRFTGPEESTLSADKLGVDFDVRSSVEGAYDVGRRGGILGRIGDRIGAAWGTVSVPAVVDYKQDVARSEIKNLAAQANEKPQDAYVSVSGSKANAVDSREGYAVDVEATMQNVDQALKGISGEAEVVGGTQEPAVLTPAAQTAADKAGKAMSEPVVLTSGSEKWKLSPEEIGKTLSFTPQGGEIKVDLDQDRLRDALSKVYDGLEADPVEAGFEFNGNGGISVTKSQKGAKIEDDKLFGAIESGLFDGKREYEVPVVTSDPKLTTDQAEKLKPTALIGSYRTDYAIEQPIVPDTYEERVQNLDIASKAITGVTVAPGEVFSINDVVSPLKYNETLVIINGQETKADGGGLCQVTSTLYNAANYADLEILERHPHDSQLPYIRPGMDATVWFGALDMKFKNTTDGYLFLREYVANDGYIYAEIYGQPTGDKVEMDSEPDYVGSDASKWTTYKKVTDKDGNVTFDDVLHKDTYKPLIDDHGKPIPPNDPYLPVAPVNP
jgi:vancomycin resistance protein YoaR